MKPNVLKKHGGQILAIIESAGKLPPAEHPKPLPAPIPKNARDQGKRIKKLINQQAENLNLPVELLLSGKITTPILRTWLDDGYFSLPDSMTGWRREAIGVPLIKQLNS